jgi:hypothetical protein
VEAINDPENYVDEPEAKPQNIDVSIADCSAETINFMIRIKQMRSDIKDVNKKLLSRLNNLPLSFKSAINSIQTEQKALVT